MARPRNNPGDLAELPSELRTDRPKGDQIREILERLTRSLPAGTVLPSERVLAERFGVARMTVRQEVDRVVADGLADRRPGGGTFVAEPRPSRLLASSFSQDMRTRGLTPGAKVLEHRAGTADEALAAELEEPVGTPVLHLVRLRTADGEPMAIERTALSLRRYPGLDTLDFADLSLYDELAARWGVSLGMVNASIVAAPPASTEDADLLGIDRTTPCLVITSAPRTAAGDVIEFGRSTYRSDRYDITVAYRTT
ncbi:transcriptional regulator, GntR family [Kribbella flavida DSM 17836]|uniref:Transcriptional regulator, GntR family n=1 Tax=Kribbella flavida (strain DSM 17836 / JCM 10339 / NBRC 14399) TaxID=479435 RepID=D2PVT6_KRIFD|nr:GntR family transcriptional regulator [Kribbella flavida]ADB29593.1 transcriptional regulator, GntR family [Kribbella flavida DSM 17836]